MDRRLTNIGENIDGQYIQKNREAATPNTYRGNLRMDWDMTSKHRVGLETKYYNNSNEYIATNVTNIDLLSANAQDYRLDTDNDQDRSWTYYALNPYYAYEIDTSGQKL